MTKSICTLTLLVKHPSINPDQITQLLALEPELTQVKGQLINAGGKHHYRSNTWQYSVKIETEESIDKLNEALSVLLLHLEGRKEQLDEIYCGEGSVDIFFRATGLHRVYTVISPDITKSISVLGLSFGFEIFN